jgi:hypothetical protein
LDRNAPLTDKIQQFREPVESIALSDWLG